LVIVIEFVFEINISNVQINFQNVGGKDYSII